MKNEFQINSTIPTFTTPTLDFNNHYRELEDLVEQLYKFKKQGLLDDLEELKQKTLERFNLLAITRNSKKLEKLEKFDPTLSLGQKGKYHYLRGKILDISDFTYSKDAEEDLTRACKYNPLLAQAWSSLGECYWKKGDFKGALLCFNKGLKLARSKDALLNMAMVLRANPESIAVIEESIKLCKEAIELDVQDSDSWVGLGTTYLKLFFDFSHDSKDLAKSLVAYNKASSNSSNPDIYRNRGLIQYYMEEYDLAIRDFKIALKDSKYQPVCERDIDDIYKYVKTISDSLGQLKPLLTRRERKSVPIKGYKTVSVSELEDESSVKRKKESSKTGVSLKILQRAKHPFASSCIADDGAGNIIVVVIYNIKMDLIKPKDIIFVADAKLKTIGLKELNIEYQVIRNENPALLLLNDQPILDSDIVYTWA